MVSVFYKGGESNRGATTSVLELLVRINNPSQLSFHNEGKELGRTAYNENPFKSLPWGKMNQFDQIFSRSGPV